MKALTTFSPAIIFLVSTAQAVPEGMWTVLEHRSITPVSDLMLDGCVLADGMNGMIGGGDIVLFTWDGGLHWYNSIVPETPAERDILGIHATSADSLWAACDDGYVFRTCDGGTTWQIQRPTSTNMFEVFFLDHLRGWAGGSTYNGSNHLIRTTDGGETWHDASFGSNSTVIVAIFFLDEDTGWVGGKDGSNHPCLYRTDDGGLSWSRQDLPLLPYNSAVESVEFFDCDNGWVATNNSQSPGYILSTTDGGANWSINTELPLQYTRFDPLDETDFAAVSYGWSGEGWLSTSKDGGLDWETLPMPLYGFIPAIAHFERSVVVAGTSSSLSITMNSGEEWESVGSSETVFESMAWAGCSRAFAAGDGGSFSSPDGDIWSGLAGLPGGSAVFSCDESRIWIVDRDPSGDEVWRTDDGGTSWACTPTGSINSLSGLFFADFDSGWVFGQDGLLLATSDGGASWSVQFPGTDMDVNDAFFTGPGCGWAAGGKGSSAFISHTSDGLTWELQQLPSSPPTAPVEAVFFLDASRGWAISENGCIYGTDDGGWTWMALSQLPCLNGRDVLMSDALSGWALSHDGSQIFFTVDGGLTWTSDWNLAYGESGPLRGLAARPDGTYWAYGDEATVLRFDPDPTSISETMAPVGGSSSFSIPENPVSGPTVLVSLCCPDGGEARVDLYDMAGRLVASSGPVRVSAGANCIRLDVSDLCNGMYLVRYGSGASDGTGKLLIFR